MLLLVQGLFSYSTKLNFVRDTVAIFDNSPIIEDRFLVTKEFRYQLLLYIYTCTVVVPAATNRTESFAWLMCFVF